MPKKFFKVCALILLAVFLILVITVFVARGVNAATSKIRTENGIQRAEFVTLGGIEQYVQIRGEDKENPVIIFLHGGPGSNVGFMSCYWQGDIEKDYTVVHWDQRGCANTFFRDQSAERPTIALLLSDLNELVDYIRTEFDEEQVIIMGHSWGTVLGSLYVSEHPEKISHYVAVGQVVDTMLGEELAMREAARLAAENGNSRAAEEILAGFERIMSIENPNISSFLSLRTLTGPYLPKGDSTSSFALSVMGTFSPDMTFSDLRWYLFATTDFEAYLFSNGLLAGLLFSKGGFSMHDHITEFEVPVTFISGDCDWVTPYPVVEQFFNDITAPHKEYILMENAGHSPYLDNPDVFSQALLSALAG